MKRFVVLALLVIAPIASAQQNPDWLKHAAFYQIYPSSYQDSDGNGIGDIAGIRYPRRDQERDHRQDRGTDASGLSRPPHPGSPFS